MMPSPAIWPTSCRCVHLSHLMLISVKVVEPEQQKPFNTPDSFKLINTADGAPDTVGRCLKMCLKKKTAACTRICMTHVLYHIRLHKNIHI